jgi:hypothetical protein
MADRRCTARSKQTGQRCGHYAIRGANVCRHHGGAAPQVKEAARRRLQAMIYPALAAFEELLEQKEFPTVRFATSREVINREFGKPGEVVDVTVNVSVDQVAAAINAWKARHARNGAG